VELFDNDAEFDDLEPLCTIPPEVRFEIPNIDTDLEPKASTAVAGANNLEAEAPQPSTVAANNLEANTDLEPEQGDNVDVEPEREPDIFDNPK